MNETKLKEMFERYKQIFEKNWKLPREEKYKWEAVKYFQDNWDINASNFGDMFGKATEKTGNLLSVVLHKWHPREMIIEIAKTDDNKVRAMFRELYNENEKLDIRIKGFIDNLKSYNTQGKFNDSMATILTTVSTLLWLKYPDKYYIYRYEAYCKVAKLFGFAVPSRKLDVNNVIIGYDMYDKVCSFISSDKELINQIKILLSENKQCYSDPKYKTLMIDFGWAINKYLSEPDSGPDIILNTESNTKLDHKIFQTEFSLNTILYGPPGTGKTYNTVMEAMKIVNPEMYKQFVEEKIGYEHLFLEFENLRFDTVKNTGQIGFITFHQSYSYEDFIEGIRPDIIEEDNETCKEVKYSVCSGIFKAICDKAAQSFLNKEIGNSTFANLINDNPIVWKVSLKGTWDNEVRTDCLENNHIRIGWDEAGKDVDFDHVTEGANVLNAFINTMQIGDIVLSCYTNKTIDAIGVVEGDYEWHEEYSDYKRLRKVRWVYKGKKDIVDINGGKTMTLSTVYKLKRIDISDVANIVNEQGEQIVVEKNDKPHVLIIDEINRGNISKIFGELITLIEDDKREKLKVILPYSQEEFTVPKNLYIIGTMNTADRSIATLDIALRRRFTFREMMPKSYLVPKKVENIMLREKFEELNRRITVLLDRDHQIGHSYFMNIETMDDLKNVWFNKIVPLINEYFYGDWEKMKLVIPGFIKEESVPRELSDYCDTEKIYSFVEKDTDDFKMLFKNMYKDRNVNN